MSAPGLFELKGRFLEKVHSGKSSNLWIFDTQSNGTITISLKKDQLVTTHEPYLISLRLLGSGKMIKSGRMVFNNHLSLIEMKKLE